MRTEDVLYYRMYCKVQKKPALLVAGCGTGRDLLDTHFSLKGKQMHCINHTVWIARIINFVLTTGVHRNGQNRYDCCHIYWRYHHVPKCY